MKVSLLISSLPTQNPTTRMRVWRSLKASGAVTLRDGVYLLPAAYDEKVTSIAHDVIAENGSAYVFQEESAPNLDVIPLFFFFFLYDDLYKQLVELRGNKNDSEKKSCSSK